jgi:hypothetical protein
MEWLNAARESPLPDEMVKADARRAGRSASAVPAIIRRIRRMEMIPMDRAEHTNPGGGPKL